MTHAEKAERRKAIAKWALVHGGSSAATQFGVTLNTVYTSCREHGVVLYRCQKHSDAMERGDYLRDRAKDEQR